MDGTYFDMAAVVKLSCDKANYLGKLLEQLMRSKRHCLYMYKTSSDCKYYQLHMSLNFTCQTNIRIKSSRPRMVILESEVGQTRNR
jgi:hypothetical protein